MKTWIIVAHRDGVKVLERRAKHRTPELIAEVPNPEGKKKDKELGTDKPGRSMQRGARSVTRHALASRQQPREHELEEFLRQIASSLESDLRNKLFDQLVLVAEPHTMGVFKAVLGKRLLARVGDTVTKDLYRAEGSELAEYL